MKNKIKQRAVILILLMIPFQYMKGQGLDQLIEIGLENSPILVRYETQYALSKEKIEEGRSVPNTEFGFGYYVSEPETRTGTQRYKISARQMLPWFGTLTSRSNYNESLSESSYEDLVVASRKLVLNISESYYRLFALKEKQRVLALNLELVRDYEQLALSDLESNKGSAIDVLKIQIRKNELNQLNQSTGHAYRSELAVLNKLLNRNVEEPVDLPNDMPLPLDGSEVRSVDISVHPELVKYDKLYRSVEESEQLNRKAASPMIGFGLDYINVEPIPNVEVADNGKDVLMPMLAVSIPIFSKKYKSVSKQNTLKQEELQSQKLERKNALEALLEKANNDRAAARLGWETQEKNLRELEEVASLEMSRYASGLSDFNELLYLEELKLKLSLRLLEYQESFFRQSLLLDYLGS